MVTPSILIAEEFNDNVLLSGSDKESDFITTITPGIGIVVAGPEYRILADYSFTSALYAEGTVSNEAFERQVFTLDSSYRASPTVTLSLGDAFVMSRDAGTVSTPGIAAGRGQSWSNSVTPGVAWAMTPSTGLRVAGMYTATRFDTEGSSDTDTYRIGPAVDHRFTERFTGLAGYDYTVLDIRDGDTFQTHTPRIGGRYRVTETITVSGSAGPTFEYNGDSRVTPAASADYTQRMSWGLVRFSYDRSVGTASGVSTTTTDNQVFAGLVSVALLATGVRLEFAGAYTTSKSSDDSTDIDTFGATVRALYQVNDWMGLFASYGFFRQDVIRTTTAGVDDFDQNRVIFGVRLARPFLFF